MTISSQQYAGLTTDSYEDKYPVGVFPPGKQPPFEYEGVQYKVLEHVNNRRTGYQGTVYQREDTGEIVVAHRGTEGDKFKPDFPEFFRDMVRADGGMVIMRANLQADDAIALTERANVYAARNADDFGGRAPEVTVTGHSLGGALAQITAHKFGLRGETFNAFGAVSLVGHNVPAGPNDRMINHVTATDFVSAASPHYGQVRTYATPQDIVQLQAGGYFENRLADRLIPDRPAAVAGTSVSDHLMHNFLNQDKNGRPDVSLLRSPTAQSLAADNGQAIEDYRTDIMQIRAGVTHTIGVPIRGIHQGLERLKDNIEQSLREDYIPRPQGVPNVLPNNVPPGFPMSGFSSGALNQQGDALPSLQSDPAAYVDRMLAAARSGDDAGFRQLTQSAGRTSAGQELREQAVATVDLQELQVARHAEQQRALEQQQSNPVHAMRMG